MPYELDIAWLAGFLDGEGCFYIRRDKRGTFETFSPVVSVAQKSRIPLDKAVGLVGGGLVCDKRGFWIWTWCSAPTMREVLPSLLPHLTVKKAQCDLMVRFCSGMKGRGAEPYTVQEKRSQVKAYEKMKGLKKLAV